MDVTGFLPPDQFWAHIDELSRALRAMMPETPVFGVDEWSAELCIGEWATGEGHHSLVHGNPGGEGPNVLVQTGHDDSRMAVMLLRAMASSGPGPGQPIFSPSTVDDAPDRIVEIPVDRTPVLFEAWVDADTTWAAGRFGETGIVIQSRRYPIEKLVLHTVHDIAPYLAGWRAMIRESRGGI